jgi:hypothetical protein
MKAETHRQLDGAMLCIVAFTIGVVLAFAGCSVDVQSRAHLGRQPYEIQTMGQEHSSSSPVQAR